MEVTHEQMSEIISSVANGKEAFQGLIRIGMDSLMKFGTFYLNVNGSVRIN